MISARMCTTILTVSSNDQQGEFIMLLFLQSRWKPMVLVLLAGLSLFYIGTSHFIGRQVHDVVSSAAQYSPNIDTTKSLLAVTTNTSLPLKERNRAIWALGQLGNQQALSTLELLYTGKECDHDHSLCQHELYKAIRLCQGELNIAALVWRHGALTEL